MSLCIPSREEAIPLMSESRLDIRLTIRGKWENTMLKLIDQLIVKIQHLREDGRVSEFREFSFQSKPPD